MLNARIACVPNVWRRSWNRRTGRPARFAALTNRRYKDTPQIGSPGLVPGPDQDTLRVVQGEPGQREDEQQDDLRNGDQHEPRLVPRGVKHLLRGGTTAERSLIGQVRREYVADPLRSPGRG
jgi:hypothetical protein